MPKQKSSICKHVYKGHAEDRGQDLSFFLYTATDVDQVLAFGPLWTVALSLVRCV